MQAENEVSRSHEVQLERIALPRGGVVVNTSVGPIQVGMPPETIKDAMSLGIPVPRYFVVPSEPFTKNIGPTMGINVAEFEFPAYCNFFMKRRTATLIVQSQEVEHRIRKVFQETLFGPEFIDTTEDYASHVPEEHHPALDKELGYFRKFGDKLITLDMLISFIHFEEGVATIDDNNGNVVHIEKNKKSFHFSDSKGIASIPDTVCLPTTIESNQITGAFNPPTFGVTILGNSHGFDPNGKTSGYVLWINRRGIMIDPPPFSSSILMANKIPPVLIDGVIITHCHADHDAGTFQKILQEGRITLITTPTIYGSFLRKYSALSGLDAAFLKNVLLFRPVRIGDQMSIRGASFRFFYSLHSIPCIGFEVTYGGKSIAFSGDHMNDPDRIKALHQEGVLTDTRMQELLNFPWHCDMILHEAGVPPIHTPLKTLEALDIDIKKRLYVVHASAKDIAPSSGLVAAPEGVHNTLVLDIDPVPHAEALEILDLVRRIELFSSLSLAHSYELLQMAKKHSFPEFTTIVKSGTRGDKFYVIMRGEAQVIVDVAAATATATATATADTGIAKSPSKGGERRFSKVVKRYTTGDYFGEQAIVTPHGKRTADIISSTAIELLEFDAGDFNWISKGTDIKKKIASLVESRNNFVWSTIARNRVFSTLSATQKTQLELALKRMEVHEGEFIWKIDSPCDVAVFVEEGSFILEAKPTTPRQRCSLSPRRRSCLIDIIPTNYSDQTAIELKKGAFVGDVDALMSPDTLPTTTQLKANTHGSLLVMQKSNLRSFLSENPGVLFAIMGSEYMT